MGLDMYLTRIPKVESNEEAEELLKIGNYDENRYENDEDVIKVAKEVNEGFDPERHFKTTEYFKHGWVGGEVGYWRKANAIHAWFVRNVQNGEDKCEPYVVSKEQLEDLVKTCNAVQFASRTDLLPTQGGFFFGSTDYDEYYYEDIKSTIEQIQKVLEETDFEKETIVYQSSW